MDIFNSVLSNQSTASFTEGSFFLCLGASIAFGLIIAFVIPSEIQLQKALL